MSKCPLCRNIFIKRNVPIYGTIICSICFEEKTNPILGNCGHMLCLECSRIYINENISRLIIRLLRYRYEITPRTELELINLLKSDNEFCINNYSNEDIIFFLNTSNRIYKYTDQNGNILYTVIVR